MNTYLPTDVPSEKEEEFLENFTLATGGSGRLMLFAGDQKVEHLNKDFFGPGITAEDNDPEHLFKIASIADIGVFATQFGLISRYGRKYPKIPYLVKLNSKTNIIPVQEKDPLSEQWLPMDEVVGFKKNSGLQILGVGYTLYLGSEHEHIMLREAARAVHEAHKNGMIAVLWIYPKGRFISDEHDPSLIAGAAGVGACLGADFVKLKVPFRDGKFDPDLLRIVTEAAGNTGVLCEGGGKVDEKDFLIELHEQIHKGNSRGNGTGRNIHQRPLAEAIKMAGAIYAVTVKNATVDKALSLLAGE